MVNPNDEINCGPIVVEVDCNRVSSKAGVKYVKVFMKVNIHDGYFPTINMWLDESALKVNN